MTLIRLAVIRPSRVTPVRWLMTYGWRLECATVDSSRVYTIFTGRWVALVSSAR